jgi:hypothetical protein
MLQQYKHIKKLRKHRWPKQLIYCTQNLRRPERRRLEWTVMKYENRKPTKMINAPAEEGKEDGEE